MFIFCQVSGPEGRLRVARSVGLDRDGNGEVGTLSPTSRCCAAFTNWDLKGLAGAGEEAGKVGEPQSRLGSGQSGDVGEKLNGSQLLNFSTTSPL